MQPIKLDNWADLKSDQLNKLLFLSDCFLNIQIAEWRVLGQLE